MPVAGSASRWVPLSWPSAWKDPRNLDLVADTPINCVVFETLPPDSAVVGEARRRELAIVDWSRPEASGIAAGEAAKIPWKGAHPVVAITDAVWPGIQSSSSRARDAVEAGPTGAPWIDANGWLVQLARVRAPEKTVWLASRPPDGRQNVVPESAYLLAIADAATPGARWLVSLDTQLAQDLATGQETALGRWRKMAASLRFFEEHRNWADGRSRAVVAVVSSFSGGGEFLATEVLNLSARRNLLHVPLPAGQAESADFRQLKAVVWVDEDAPDSAVLRKLDAFVHAGGVLVAPAWAEKLAAAGKRLPSAMPGYNVRQIGRGRIAVPAAPWTDPFAIAADAHVLIGHREDPLTLFNGGSMAASYRTSPDGPGDIVELLRYSSDGRGEQVTLRVRRGYSSAKWITLEAPQPADVRLEKVKDGVELALPPFDVFAALKLQ
jgi:hypothetical protein